MSDLEKPAAPTRSGGGRHGDRDEHASWTRFPQLNETLRSLVEGSASILGEDLIGAYLQGSFAVGDADEHSDCDFIVVTGSEIGAREEAALRRFHLQLRNQVGRWYTGVEGSYVSARQLRRQDEPTAQWLFVDHQASAQMEWSTHCNTMVARWSLRERGITLTGPPSSTLLDPVDPQDLRRSMLPALENFFPELRTWIDIAAIAWGQRTAVETLCRMLYTVHRGEVTSKRASLLWAEAVLDPRWNGLVIEAREGRPDGWDADQAPRPGSITETEAFAAYALHHAQQLIG